MLSGTSTKLSSQQNDLLGVSTQARFKLRCRRPPALGDVSLQAQCEWPSRALHHKREIFILAGMPDSKPSPIQSLLEIMAKLRDPAVGCPWDVEQTFETIAPYTLEEAYEVDHAIRTQDMESLCDELGDLLLQVVFHAQMADEAGLFAFDDVASAICDKLVRRHPHVFGDPARRGERESPRTSEDQTRFWEDSKAQERAIRADAKQAPTSPFDGIPRALPALARAAKLYKRASRLSAEGSGVEPISEPDRGFDLAAFDSALEVLVREAGQTQVGSEDSAKRLLGQVLSRCVEAARTLGVDPEAALSADNFAFESRVERDH
jgi:MazG family protein